MNYVKCIDNKAHIYFPGESREEADTTDLTLGKIYKAAPQTEDDRRLGELRVYDDTGEDYLFPDQYFEASRPNGDDDALEAITVYVSTYLRDVLRAEALAAQKSVSSLVREWIDERLDLPVS